jgi:hypothetical protein
VAVVPRAGRRRGRRVGAGRGVARVVVARALGAAALSVAAAGHGVGRRAALGAVAGAVLYGTTLPSLTDFSVPGYVVVIVVKTALLALALAAVPRWWALPAGLVLLGGGADPLRARRLPAAVAGPQPGGRSVRACGTGRRRPAGGRSGRRCRNRAGGGGAARRAAERGRGGRRCSCGGRSVATLQTELLDRSSWPDARRTGAGRLRLHRRLRPAPAALHPRLPQRRRLRAPTCRWTPYRTRRMIAVTTPAPSAEPGSLHLGL